MENQVGYGFRPNDEELVGFYLPNKIKGKTSLVEGAINEVNICKYDPWNLRFQSKYKSRDPMWYFFSRRDNKYGNGNRQNRTTFSGKWKLTGEPVDVKDQWGTWCGTPGKKIGHKRVLVFLHGINSEKPKSDWVIHEFHYDLLPEHLRTYVICRLEYKGDDWTILSANATDPTPNYVANMTNSAGSVVNQSRQGYSGSYNTEYDSPNHVQQFNENINMQQPVQGSLGSFNHSSEYASTNHGQQFGGNYNMHQPVGGGYLESFNHSSEFDPPNYGQWLGDYLFNPQQSVPYSDPSVDELGKILKPIIEENLDSFVPERTYMQEHYSDHRPKKPVTGVIADDSSDSETDSTIFGDTSSSTDSVGSSNELNHTPIDDIPSLNTIEPLHNFEAQEQPKQQKSHLQGKEKVINTQKSECEWKMAEDSNKKTPSTNTVKQSWIVLDKRSQMNEQWNYLTNMIIGVLLFISIIGWIILVG